MALLLDHEQEQINECLNMNWFMSLEDARDKVERWRRDYNEFVRTALLYT